MRSITDLEAVALGCIWRLGACSAYAVRREFLSSPSARYSASAGAVYPMIRRLERAGLLRGREAPRGRRRGHEYRCTRAGLAALRAWLSVPASPEELVTTDPLRTRILFLALLPSAARLRWLERAERLLREHARTVSAALRASAEDVWQSLAHRNALLQARARLRWIAEARTTLRTEGRRTEARRPG